MGHPDFCERVYAGFQFLAKIEIKMGPISNSEIAICLPEYK